MRTALFRPLLIPSVTLAALAAGCSSIDATPETIATETHALLGDKLSGISAEAFAEAKANFNELEDINDGVGPVFNERSCGSCHQKGAMGGAGENIERR